VGSRINHSTICILSHTHILKQFVLRVNNAPMGGALAVTPSKGYALKAAFRLLASGWMDDEGDYPLTYTFSADETLTLQSASPADSYRGGPDLSS